MSVARRIFLTSVGTVVLLHFPTALVAGYATMEGLHPLLALAAAMVTAYFWTMVIQKYVFRIIARQISDLKSLTK